MAASLQEVANAAYEIKEATKPIGEAALYGASELNSLSTELATLTQGNSNSGPKANEALRRAVTSLGHVSDSINRMNRSIEGFINELLSK
jgi:methyl-accepting chemotaxis protein